MFPIAPNFPHLHGSNFYNEYIALQAISVPPGFKPDLTKCRLNEALYLCKTLMETWASNGDVVGFVVLGVV